MVKKIRIKENQVDEARQMHTWNITYTGKGNKAKTHMVDAPDAYEANRKARRELGIAYTDIDDVTMVENKKMDGSPSYNDIKYVMKCASNVSTQKDLDAVLASLLSIDKKLYQTYSEKSRNDEMSPAYVGKLISDDLYYLVNDREMNEDYNDSYYTSVKEEVRDFLDDEIGDEVETFVDNLMDKFPVQLIASEVPSYNMDWCKEEFDIDDWYKLEDDITKKITYRILTELFYNT